MINLKVWLHCKTQLNSTVLADKELWPKTGRLEALGIIKTAVLDWATL